MIAAFGNFVVAGNFVVGAVIFLILTLIQFLVTSKGPSGGGGRRSLHARRHAGQADEHRRRPARSAHLIWTRRASVATSSTESQLGAMDGAMKFVKGDAIAGIIITIVNIIVGMIVGVTPEGYDCG